MAKLWKKSQTPSLHKSIEAYTVGSDYIFDLQLFPYDIQASIAHAAMLCHIGILTENEKTILTKALEGLQQQWEQNEISITKEDEDCHTVIENALIAKCGDIGKKIHTGRSRNDQVLVAVRLLMKAELNIIHQKIVALAELFLEKAHQYEKIPLPGYTHTQQAMLSSVGHLFSSYHEMLMFDSEVMASTLHHINQNPLGSAAGFGVSIPLDRSMTSTLLRFEKTQKNSLWCQSSRGKMEGLVMESLLQAMTSLGKYASDMLLFTTQEFAFFEADDSVVTGSSIMPQKRNLDGLEILRGNVSSIMAKKIEIQDIAKNLISGYHRDLQLLKKPLLESFAMVKDSLEVAALYLENLIPNQTTIEAKITKELFLADIANQLVSQQNMPFRDAYTKAFDYLDAYTVDFAKNMAEKISEGSVGNWK